MSFTKFAQIWRMGGLLALNGFTIAYVLFQDNFSAYSVPKSTQ
jgi:hypothetical protein